MAKQKQKTRVLVMHRKKGVTGPVAQRTKNNHVKGVGSYRDQNGPSPA